MPNEISEVSNSKQNMENRIKETVDNFITDNPDVVLTEIKVDLCFQHLRDGAVKFLKCVVTSKVEII